MDVPRQAYAVLVRSPHAHARIVRIDTRGALKSPGVLAVLTGAEVAADGLGNLPTDRTRKRRDGTPAFATPRPLLARERVRHVGDPVALVVADAHQHAADAAERVAVEYEPLPALAATADARKPGVPVVWDEAPDNVAFVWSAGPKDAVTHAFESAPHVTRLPFVVSRVAVAPMEPRAAVGEYDRRTERYTLHTGIQGPHGTRTLLAATLGVEQNRVRVVSADVGGSFGMRSGLYPEMVLVLWAAKRLGRPVKWTSSRREGMVTDGAGRDNVSTVALALGIDPIELRRRNLIPPSAMPFKTGLVFTYDCGDFARGMEMALSLADHAGFAKRRAQARERSKLRGLGVANAIEVAGGPYTAVNPDTAEIRVNPDGTVTLFAASTTVAH